VTLLIFLILLSAGAYFLLRALNRTQGPVAAGTTTQRALNQAREALLGYAVRYPENAGVPLTAGPGRLPCPDTRLDAGEPAGAADSPCAASSGTETGRFPWHTLDVPELLDGSGAPLWYAVSDAFRAAPVTAINSETAGTLDLATCTGTDDIVALIIAPGVALANQSRSPANFDADDYLEGENRTRGDRCFSALRDDQHNDEVLAITRRELLAVVETRVLADVANALQRYRAAHVAYPWLSAFAPTGANTFRGAVGTLRGTLPLRQIDPGNDAAADPASPFAFAAPFVLRWSAPIAGTVTRTAATSPSEDCVRSSASVSCDSGSVLTSGTVLLAGDVLGAGGGEWQPGICKATQGQRMSCRAVREIGGPPETLRRTYTAVLTHWPYEIENPSATAPRFQHFARFSHTLASEPSPELIELTLSDVRIAADGSETALGETRLTLNAGDVIESLELRHVTFDLEVDDDGKIDPTDPALDPTPDTLAVTRRSPGELPHWLVANDWHHLLSVAIAAARAPGSDPAGDCTAPAADCLTVQWSRAGAAPQTLIAVEGLVLGAGPPLTAGTLAQTRPGATLADYFEGANALDDTVFERRDATADFNDRLRALDTDD